MLPVADLHVSIGARPLGSNIEAPRLAGRVDTEAVSALLDLDVVVDAAAAARVVVRLCREVHSRLRRWRLADTDSWLWMGVAIALADAIAIFGRTAQVQRLELPPLRPQRLAHIPARVLVAVPFATAPGVLPVADLDLTVGAEARTSRVQAADLAVGVDAHTLTHADFLDVVNFAPADLALKGLDVESVSGLRRHRGGCRGISGHSHRGVA